MYFMIYKGGNIISTFIWCYSYLTISVVTWQQSSEGIKSAVGRKIEFITSAWGNMLLLTQSFGLVKHKKNVSISTHPFSKQTSKFKHNMK